MLHTFTCSVCKQEKTYESDFTTGYGVDKDGNKTCYDCIGKRDAAELENMPIGGRTMLYLNTKEKTLTNWPSSLVIPVSYIRTGHHNIAGKRYDTWFKFGGNHFHAVTYGDYTQIAHVKRIKPIN